MYTHTISRNVLIFPLLVLSQYPYDIITSMIFSPFSKQPPSSYSRAIQSGDLSEELYLVLLYLT